MYTIDSALRAEIDYRNNRTTAAWSPSRREVRPLPKPRRRLHLGHLGHPGHAATAG